MLAGQKPWGLLSGGMVAFVLAISAASCGDDAPEQSPTPVRLGVIRSADQLPVFVMAKQGFAADHGLRLDLRTVQSGGEVIELMAEGGLDAGLPGVVPVLNAATKGVVPAKVVGVAGGPFADRTHPYAAVVVGPDIRDWSDLSDAVVAVNAVGTITEASARLRLQLEGVTGYDMAPLPFPNQGLAVRTGSVAAASMVEPFITQSVERGDGRVMDWVIGGGGEPFPDFQIVMFAVRTSLVEEDPDVVRDLIAAYVQAHSWIDKNPDEAREILASELVVSPTVGEKMVLPRFPVDPLNDPDLIALTQDRLLSLDPGRRSVPVSSLYDEGMLPEALRGSAK